MSGWDKFKAVCVSAGTTVASTVLEYDTPKIVHIKNKTVGVINRLVQLAIIGYIVGYAIIYEKGYQRTEDVVSAVTTKVQGIGYTNGTGVFENAGDRVWDSSDYVVPPQSPNSVFIMTNMWVTNQTQGVCTDPDTQCDTEHPCMPGNFTKNGVSNGTCDDGNTSTCFIQAWCPVEREDKIVSIDGGPKLLQAVNFTILIKNTIQFPDLDAHFRRRNIHDTADEDISNCRFNFDDNLFCPVFTLGTIIGILERPTSFEELAVTGAVLGLRIEWNCNLDRDYSNCKPRYSARRLDDRNAAVSPGFNFRFANTWTDSNNNYRRQLIKAYGIRINIVVIGQGGKFDFPTLILKIGSGIALLAIASVVSDIVILYLVRERRYYRDNKYVYVKGKATIFKGNLPFGNNSKFDKLLSPAREDHSQSEFVESDNYDANYVSVEPQVGDLELRSYILPAITFSHPFVLLQNKT